jgi:hypothetical protein
MTDSATVTVDLPPTITADPVGTSFCSGNSTTLSVTAAGTAPLHYQWYQGTASDTSSPVGTDSNSYTTPALTATTSYWVRVTNGCGNADSQTTIVTVHALPTITTDPASIPHGSVGVVYTPVSFTQTGGVLPITWSESGALPMGMNFLAGVLSGTPTQMGSFPFTVTATDANGCAGSRSYILDVCPLITVIPSTLPDPVVGFYYYKVFTASGGAAPYTFSYTGSLPQGLHLSASGTLSGTPTSGGFYAFTVTATDSNGCTGSVSFNFTISAYDVHLWDDQGRSVLCLSTKLKTWSYRILKGTGSGSVYTGTGTISNANGGFVFLVSGTMTLQAQVFTTAHRATAVFRYPVRGISSSLYDANTLDDPPGCGEPNSD